MLSFRFIFILLALLNLIWVQLLTHILHVDGNLIYTIPILLFNLLYLIIAMKYFYGNRWGLAIFKGFIGILWIGALFRFYAISLSFYTLDSLSK